MSDNSQAAGGVRVERHGAVLELQLNRPQRRNAIDDAMMLALTGALEHAGMDEGVRAIRISGVGEHFCSGADIVARNAPPEGRPRVGAIQRRLPAQAHRLIPVLCSVQVPVVCAVSGWAVGLGLQIAAASDFTVAAENATFWAPFSERGFTPDSGATWLLPRLVGMVRARELLLLGRRLSGTEAAEWGLVHQAVPREQVEERSTALAAELAAGPTVSLGLTKWLIQAGAAAPLGQHLADEAFAMELSSRTDDFKEGLRALADRRRADFKGR